MKGRKYMYISLEGFLDSVTFSEINKALINGVSQSDVNKFLFDTSRIGVIKNEEMIWLTENMAAWFAKNRMSKVVFIKPENVFGNKSIETLAHAMSISIDVKILPCMEQAEKWLFHD